jgi:hypothetical protein
MNHSKNLITIVFLLFLTNLLVGQKLNSGKDQAILGSFHLTSYFDNNAFTPHEFVPGVAFEYRKIIDSLSSKFHIAFAIGIESVPVKIVNENDSYYTNTHFNFTNSLGLYYSLSRSYYLGLYSSMDIPFASKENSNFNGSTYKHFEFYFQYLNINFSAGLNLGKTIDYKEHQFIVELHFKALGLLGLKSNDYWHYPEDGIPYYSGLRLGYRF